MHWGRVSSSEPGLLLRVEGEWMEQNTAGYYKWTCFSLLKKTKAWEKLHCSAGRGSQTQHQRHAAAGKDDLWHWKNARETSEQRQELAELRDDVSVTWQTWGYRTANISLITYWSLLFIIYFHINPPLQLKLTKNHNRHANSLIAT